MMPSCACALGVGCCFACLLAYFVIHVAVPMNAFFNGRGLDEGGQFFGVRTIIL